MKILGIVMSFKPGESSFRSFVGTEFDGGLRHYFDNIQSITSKQTSYTAGLPQFFRRVYEWLSEMFNRLYWCPLLRCRHSSFLAAGLGDQIHF